MSKSEEMMRLVVSYASANELLIRLQHGAMVEDAPAIPILQRHVISLKRDLQAIADRQDKLFNCACDYLHELEYNDYVTRNPIEIAVFLKLSFHPPSNAKAISSMPSGVMPSQ